MIRSMYVFCLVVWGLNFIAVKIQGTPVSLDVSLAYRLMGGCALFWILARLKSVPFTVQRQDLPYVVSFGVCNFALSYLLLYYATIASTAALVTLVFSMKTVMTPLALRIFLGDRIDSRLIAGGAVSLTGVLVLLFPFLSIDLTHLTGFGLAVLGTAVTAVGDAASARNSRRGVDPISANCVGFTSGMILMLLVCVALGREFSLPLDAHYLGALIYLTIVASFLAWLFYLKLVGEIGAAKSGYMVALFPAVGGIASVLLGETELNAYIVFGCLLSCLGALYSLGGLQLKVSGSVLNRR
ncbi:DMT family transporter [uncultured Tateyamaria sp.]|uniref:DMT family transporter n=1 Tax=uncultured Tateyamaria sp. TaxID=455651 RepID=UPI00260B8B63|nr:DMT family transporter [uncultured Tateyamaria sp.]